MDQFDGYEYVCVARNEDFVDLEAARWGYTRSAVGEGRAQAERFVYPVVDVWDCLYLVVGPLTIAGNSGVDLGAEFGLLVWVLGEEVEGVGEGCGCCFARRLLVWLGR
jgi:hypothetical protein